MNLDELQSVQSRERQASSLQHLRSSFYEEAAGYVGELRAERNEVAAASDNPFEDPEVERLSDEIRTAEGTVESIYERRVGKVVKLASIAAADMPYDDGGLTKEEEQLFGTLVEAIEGNRERVLSVLDGESPALDCTPTEDGRSETSPAESAGTGPSGGGGGGQDDAPGSGSREAPADPSASRDAPGPTNTPDAGPSPTGGASRTGPDAEESRPTPPDHPVESGDPTPTEAESPGPAADGPSDGKPLDIGSAMGGSESDDPGLTGAGEQTSTPTPSETASRTGRTDPGPDPVPASGGTTTGRDAGDAGDEGNEEDGGTGDDDPVERTMVRVTADVGNIFGVDGRSYDLSAEDVVTLPSSNAENLVSRDAAVRLD